MNKRLLIAFTIPALLLTACTASGQTTPEQTSGPVSTQTIEGRWRQYGEVREGLCVDDDAQYFYQSAGRQFPVFDAAQTVVGIATMQMPITVQVDESSFCEVTFTAELVGESKFYGFDLRGSTGMLTWREASEVLGDGFLIEPAR